MAKTKKHIRFNGERKNDKIVVAWVNAVADWMRVSPQTVARLMLMDGCAAFAAKNSIALPPLNEITNQSAG
jgi:hypothetical protein